MKGKFDPELLSTFLHFNGIYPAGTWVELSSGYAARVESQTDSLLRPVVHVEKAVVRERGEVKLESIAPAVRDLSEDEHVTVTRWLGHSEAAAIEAATIEAA